MPCIWGKHNNSQVVMPVTILPPGINQEKLSNINQNDRTFQALIDTGSQSTSITKKVADAAGLSSTGTERIQGVSGVQIHNNYSFFLGFPSKITQTKPNIKTTTFKMLETEIEGVEFEPGNHKFDVLLGMDVISKGALRIDGNGSFSFSY